MRKLLVLVCLVPAVAFAQGKEGAKPAAADAAKPPPPAPEVKKTVDAFVGTWKFEGTLTGVPGAPGPVKVTETLVCKAAAGGRVADCSGKGTAPGGGKYEDEALITYDEGSKAVRFVGMSSMGEVHDHKCAWKDDKTLACEPLAITDNGEPATVDLNVTWGDAKNVTVSEVTTHKDGSKFGFEGKGKRK